MDKQQLQEVFEKAVSAWEIRDFATFRVYRIQLFQVAMGGYIVSAARYYQSLLVRYMCAKPCEAIPFKAFAVGRACQALRFLR